MKRQRYNNDFKRKAVQMIYSSDKPVTEIASMMNIDHSILYRWKQKFRNEFESMEISAPYIKKGNNEIIMLKEEMAALRHDFELLRSTVEKAFKSRYILSNENKNLFPETTM
jgi:transposase